MKHDFAQERQRLREIRATVERELQRKVERLELKGTEREQDLAQLLTKLQEVKLQKAVHAL